MVIWNKDQITPKPGEILITGPIQASSQLKFGIGLQLLMQKKTLDDRKDES